MADIITQLEEWYSIRCVAGDSNRFGLHLENVAEGGWWLRVDLPGAELERFRTFLQPLHRSIDDYPGSWIHYSINDGAFIGGCATSLLHELLAAFLSTASQIRPNVA